jgi:uncharacterized protein (TIGR03437 family)
MSNSNRTLTRVTAVVFLLSLLIAPLVWRFAARAQTGADTPSINRRKHGIEGEWSADERAREMDLWSELNRQRMRALGLEPARAEVSVVDVDDVAVIQDNGLLAQPVNPFDLAGRAVLFTPSGSNYVVTSFAAPFDNSLGTKLDLTVAPAFSSSTEPGDDAYILQTIGFNFSLYGASYAQMAVSSNGFLTFRPANTTDAAFNSGSTDSGESLADLQTSLPRIAPYWNDLDARASVTQGDAGIYIRRDNDRVVVTWNNIRDFPNAATDNGVHRFQATLFADGRIQFTYEFAQLTSNALAGVTPGNTTTVPAVIDLRNPGADAISAPIAEVFSTTATVDLNAIIRTFYATHPNQDFYDFVYFLSDFNFNLGGGAFAFYRSVSNDVSGIGLNLSTGAALKQTLGSQRIQGMLNLNNLITAYPALPSERMVNIGGVDTALSLFAQEQGHRWLAFPRYPATDQFLLLGRGNGHWNYFLNIESTISGPAARRSSSMEGSVWRENADGTFTTVNMIDGYSRLDQYLMGLRPAADVPNTFIINNPVGTSRTRSSNPLPNVTISGAKQTITIAEVIQANGARTPDAAAAPKNFRAAFILFTQRGAEPAPATLAKLKLFRLAWESYFAQATDYLARINTGLAAQTVSRVISLGSAASYAQTVAPGAIVALFGEGLSETIAAASSQPLPTTLAGVEVRVNGVAAPLFFISPAQINFQIPRAAPATTNNQFVLGIPSGAITVEVWRDGQLTRAGIFQIAPAVPALFTFNQSGTGPAVAIDAFNFTGPPYAATRASGEPNILAFFASGIGADATDVEGNVAANVSATIDGNPVTVSYAGRTPGLTGLNQLNIALPVGITSGTHTVVVSRNGVPSSPVTIAIR